MLRALGFVALLAGRALSFVPSRRESSATRVPRRGSGSENGRVRSLTRPQVLQNSGADTPQYVHRSQSELGWYIKAISSHTLLKAEEEILLGRKVAQLGKWELARTSLRDRLGREPSLKEWATSVGMEEEEMERKLHRALRAKRAMISSNLKLVVSVAKKFNNR